MSEQPTFAPEEDERIDRIIAFITNTPQIEKGVIRAKLNGEVVFILGATRDEAPDSQSGDFMPLCILMDTDLAERIELPDGLEREGKEETT